MCLRSRRTLDEMERTKNNSLPQNNSPDTKQPVVSMTGHIGTSTSIEENPTMICHVSTSLISLGLVVSPPQVSSVPTIIGVTQNLGDPMLPFTLNFSLPPGGKEQS